MEYKAGFGETEAATLFPLLDTSLAIIIYACIYSILHTVDLAVKDKFCATVVITSSARPGPYRTGDSPVLKRPDRFGEYIGLSMSTQELVESYQLETYVSFLHAGTRMIDDRVLLTNEGRVMMVSAEMSTLEKAVELAYVGVKRVSFKRMHFRRDIGYLKQRRGGDEEE